MENLINLLLNFRDGLKNLKNEILGTGLEI